MSLLLDKLAQATPFHPAAAPGEVIVCRLCGCDDDHACIDERGRPCSWVLIDTVRPTGICSACALETGWDEFFFCYADQQEQAA
ncbi:MAG: hypothetical protein ACREHV_00995 [Rhizomicrobium sp.]